MNVAVAPVLVRLIDRFLPKQDYPIGDVGLLRKRLLVGASIAIGLLAVPYVFLYGFGFGAWRGALTLAVAALNLLATPFLLRWSKSPRLAGNWFLANMLGVLTVLAVLDGGLGVPIFAFPILPMFASGAVDNRSAAVWTGACLGVLGGLAAATGAGWSFPKELTDAQDLVFGPAVAFGMVIAIAAPMMLYRALADGGLADAAAKEARIRAIVDTAADAIVGLDAFGWIESTNRATERVFGPSARLVGQHLSDVVQGPIPTDGSAHEVVVFRDGVPIDCEIAVERVDDAYQTKFVATVRDITPRKEAERAVAEARDRAVEATRSKSRFLANITHDLRAPLNAIIGFSERLADDADTQGPAARRDIQWIQHASQQLLALINDVLDLSKIEAGRMELHPEWLDVRDLAAGVVETVGPLARTNHNRVDLDLGEQPGAMLADPTRVRQILLNLASNAAKFTKDGTIGLRVRRTPGAGGGWVVFEVWDTGIGIPADKLDDIFSEFVQADRSTARKYGGSGLGLSIARRLCTTMRGEITVSSEVGRGSSFTVRLPVGDSPVVQGADPDEEPLVLPDAPLVLVIDDDEDARELLRRALQRGGYRVVAAPDGPTGIRLCAEQRPVAVTLDVLMPGMDGWQVLSALKAEPALADIPVVLVSLVDDRSMGFALGASHYLPKPVDRETLLALLEPYRDRGARSALVVEDDPALRELLQYTLERSGWRVDLAGDGRAGLVALQTDPPDVVLLDLTMPVMDGFEFLAAVRQEPRWARLPVIVVTARDLSLEEGERLSVQAQRVLQKAATNQADLLSQVAAAVAGFTARPPKLEAS